MHRNQELTFQYIVLAQNNLIDAFETNLLTSRKTGCFDLVPLIGAFVWELTPEGYDVWDKTEEEFRHEVGRIHQNTKRAYARTARFSPHSKTKWTQD